jgi:hypothetical protein
MEEGPLTLGMGKAFARAAAGSAFAATLAGCMSSTPAPEPVAMAVPSRATFASDALVGKWGLASYRKDADKARTEAAAREQCGKPYVIGKGPTGGLMMYQADQAKPEELVVKSLGGKTFIGPATDPAGGQLDREVVSYDNSEFITQWVDPEVLNRYGTLVFVRCGGK